MTRITTALALTGTLLTAGATFADTSVGKVFVDVDLQAVSDPKATEYWTSVGEDLKAEILTRAAAENMTGANGVTIIVDLDELSLANSYETSLGLQESRLAGRVFVKSDTDASKFNTFDLSVSYKPSTDFIGEGVVLDTVTSDSEKYYQGMIGTYAERIIANLK
ncbi:MAG: hypothetical protein KJN93_06685 [Alphaproteobacteria bacterium]|nr:hypothetical protein [Alphaproteobacteria bacterium]